MYFLPAGKSGGDDNGYFSIFLHLLADKRVSVGLNRDIEIVLKIPLYSCATDSMSIDFLCLNHFFLQRFALRHVQQNICCIVFPIPAVKAAKKFLSLKKIIGG